MTTLQWNGESVNGWIGEWINDSTCKLTINMNRLGDGWMNE